MQLYLYLQKKIDRTLLSSNKYIIEDLAIKDYGGIDQVMEGI